MDTRTAYLGLELINPFILASAPPTATPAMIARAFDAGWAGAVIKTLTRPAVKNLSNRFASNSLGRQIFAFENIELLSELSPEAWFQGIRELKRDYPDRVIIGSIMGDAASPDQWIELALGCQEAGADLLELNFSCPHGYPERGQGAAIGQHADLAARITGWLASDPRITIPLLPKLSAAVTDISHIGEAVAGAGAKGLVAINSIPSIMGFDLETLEPRPSVNGYSTAGGYSGPGIRPIALRCLHELVTCPGLPVMASGGISTGADALDFLLMGAPAVQACTSVMLGGYGIIERWLAELRSFMERHNFATVSSFTGLGHRRMRAHHELDLAFRVHAQIDRGLCTACGKCLISCRDGGYGAISKPDDHFRIDIELCTGCSLCSHVCPTRAIRMVQ